MTQIRINKLRTGARKAARLSVRNKHFLMEKTPFGSDIAEKIARMSANFGKKKKKIKQQTTSKVCPSADIKYLKNLK